MDTVALLGLGRNLGREAERVTRRAEEDPPSVRRWLDRRDPGPQPLGLCERGIQFGHRQIEMDLLGKVASRPGRGHVVGDLQPTWVG